MLDEDKPKSNQKILEDGWSIGAIAARACKLSRRRIGMRHKADTKNVAASK